MPETATKKPIKPIDFYEFLQTEGFGVPDRDVIKFDTTAGVFARKDPALMVGRIYRPSRDSPFDKITVMYYVSRGQIEQALDLRDFLEENNISYKEEPPRKKIAEYLRKDAEAINSLADKLGGKGQ